MRTLANIGQKTNSKRHANFVRRSIVLTKKDEKSIAQVEKGDENMKMRAKMESESNRQLILLRNSFNQSRRANWKSSRTKSVAKWARSILNNQKTDEWRRKGKPTTKQKQQSNYDHEIITVKQQLRTVSVYVTRKRESRGCNVLIASGRLAPWLVCNESECKDMPEQMFCLQNTCCI